jgi:endonuclease/exonuclease/phosphatase family metal-dependent hydrolase
MARPACIEAVLWGIAAAAFVGSAWVGRAGTLASDAGVDGIAGDGAAAGASIAVGGSRTARAAIGTLRVITWNVGGTRDGEPHPFDHGDLDRLVALLDASQPDLLLLQEFRYSVDWPALRARLLLEEPWVKASGDMAIVALRGELHDGELIGDTAIASWRVDGRSIAVANLHASAWRATARRRQIGSALERLLAQPGPARLLGGDLNLDISQNRDLFSSDPDGDVAIYNWVATRLCDSGRGAGPTAEPDRRLDYLFTSPELRPLHARVLPDLRGPTMDHDPLDLLFIPR